MYVYLLFIDLDDSCEPVLCGVFESAKAAKEKGLKAYDPEQIVIEKWEVKK